MTLSEGITLVLRRAGLSTSASELRTRARAYLSFALAEVVPLVPWWWLDRTTTFSTSASTRTYQPVSGNVTAWYSFVDQTNDQTLTIVGSDTYDSIDVNRDETGDPEIVFLAGLDTSTGYPVVELWRIPDGTFTIRARYRADINEWTSSNDDSDFLTLGLQRILETVVIHGDTAVLQEEEGDDSAAAAEAGRQSRAVQLAQRQNLLMQGNRGAPPVRMQGGDMPLIKVSSTLVTI